MLGITGILMLVLIASYAIAVYPTHVQHKKVKHIRLGGAVASIPDIFPGK